MRAVSRRTRTLEEEILDSALVALTDDELEEVVRLCSEVSADNARLNELVNTGWLRSLGLVGYTNVSEV